MGATNLPLAPIYFSDCFKVSRALVRKYGAFDVSLVADLPLFIDPFLLFNSSEKAFQKLHEGMISYLRFLRTKSEEGQIAAGLLRAWFHFPEVRQTWLGFTEEGNSGRGLGKRFARALNHNLRDLFGTFGQESITKGSHIEKLCLIADGVGRDCISDFTTNLILGYLCDYTSQFAVEHVDEKLRRKVSITKAQFNYTTEAWETVEYDLPWHKGDFVLLTPRAILTRDETWINRTDLYNECESLPNALPNEALRAQISNYFQKALRTPPDKQASIKDRQRAAQETLRRYPFLIDYFIRSKEEHGNEATDQSMALVQYADEVFLDNWQQLRQRLASETGFYAVEGDSYSEAYKRVQFLKDLIENKGCHRYFYHDGKPVAREDDVHIMYRLTWYNTGKDVSREVNDGRGPADFKISKGAADKTIVEFKLASNSQLRRNLSNQTPIYQKASDARTSIKAILFFSQAELEKVERILAELGLREDKDVILIDARSDNKPSGSKA